VAPPARDATARRESPAAGLYRGQMMLRLPRWFLDLSLALKLTVVAAATSAVSMTVVCAAVGVYESAQLHSQLVTDTAVLVDTLGAANNATLAFNDADGAAEALRRTAINGQIQVVAILRPTGQVFALWEARPNAASSSVVTARAKGLAFDGQAFAGSRLLMARPIHLDQNVVGAIYVELDLAVLERRLRALWVGLGVAFLGTTSLAVVIGWRLQRVVSGPLVELTTITRDVSRSQQYHLRAQAISSDEIGELVTGFNEMLSHIQERDTALMSHRAELERTVAERTRQLQASLERFRLIVESTQAVPWEAAGPRLVLSYIAPQASKLFGYDHQTLTDGMSLLDLVHPEDRAAIARQLDALVLDADGHDLDLVYKGVTRHGQTIDVRTVVTADRDRESGARVFRGITVDVTRQKKLEMELLQAQKLESVGRLAAGVAHEINTPIQFVSDSIHFVCDAMADMAAVVASYGDLHAAVTAGAATDTQAAAVEAAIEQADLAYLLENIPKALGRSLEGLQRVAVIVRSMKQFAHPDRKEMGPADLNQAVDSTLTIARNEYKYVADLTTDFGVLPPVTCHIGDINQVVLNVVVNAAHAIADVVTGTDGRGRIMVTTRRDGEFAVITIADTGAGIPADVRERIFEPFFTTKGVGRGTGQGLAISRSVIMEKHRGALTFDSEVGKGTTFVIRLPIDGAAGTSQSAA
jgi:PAS domain S-box-containing protein